ncbi:SDR family oxidoreductase [Kineosporia sp. NBRC 101731]|uniref:SDR family oxidoreductase n=1 Tax=Kineosporia sp. NBRC 101731 TaxID=3032199 RepID=UPI0024A07122|nr:SDR family oxidoreductase [Kineosporia sp. NBRC 101731]GLY31462.1 oxidoreductase [Kineosporia sp. NBRC 101731]
MSKVIAITGASSGIGEATAELLAARGATVLLTARRADRLQALTDKIRSHGGRADWVTTDVTSWEDAQKLVRTAKERFGRLDVLVSNAGVATVRSFETLSTAEIDAMIDVNLRGVLYGISAALPLFREQGSGHFVQTVSTSGLRIVPGQVVYAGVKNAVRTIAEGLRQEMGDSIRVTAVSPGMTRTEFVDGASPQMREQVERVAMGPDAIARAIAFAIEQPADIDVNEIVVRPTAQS